MKLQTYQMGDVHGEQESKCHGEIASRYKTMDFNLVPADSPDWCPKCEKPRKEWPSCKCDQLTF